MPLHTDTVDLKEYMKGSCSMIEYMKDRFSSIVLHSVMLHILSDSKRTESNCQTSFVCMNFVVIRYKLTMNLNNAVLVKTASSL